MIYSFSKDIFQTSSETSLELLDKIWLNSKKRHFLFISDTLSFSAIKQSIWYGQLRQSSKDQINEQFIASFQQGKNRKKIIISNDSDTSFSLVEAFELLNRPLTLVLENMEYDKYFIDALIRNFKLGKKIKRHYDNGWLVYRNGGGNNIPNVINVMKDRFENNKTTFPKDSSTYIRTFVLIDSDKKHPSSNEVATDKNSLLDFIKQNTFYHVTLKREMENYLPDEAFAEISNNQTFIETYLKLTPEQKDFFDIQKGFPNKNFNQLEVGIRDLYDSVLAEDKKILKNKGLIFLKPNGKKDSFKARFPKLFESDSITRSNLKKRASSTNIGELEIILQKINDLL